MLNVFDRMENIVWKGEYAGMQNFLISHNILVETLIPPYFAWETNSLTAFIDPTWFCFMQTTGKSLLAPNVRTKWTVPKLRTVPGIKQTWDVIIC